MSTKPCVGIKNFGANGHVNGAAQALFHAPGYHEALSAAPDRTPLGDALLALFEGLAGSPPSEVSPGDLLQRCYTDISHAVEEGELGDVGGTVMALLDGASATAAKLFEFTQQAMLEAVGSDYKSTRTQTERSVTLLGTAPGADAALQRWSEGSLEQGAEYRVMSKDPETGADRTTTHDVRHHGPWVEAAGPSTAVPVTATVEAREATVAGIVRDIADAADENGGVLTAAALAPLCRAYDALPPVLLVEPQMMRMEWSPVPRLTKVRTAWPFGPVVDLAPTIAEAERFVVPDTAAGKSGDGDAAGSADSDLPAPLRLHDLVKPGRPLPAPYTVTAVVVHKGLPSRASVHTVVPQYGAVDSGEKSGPAEPPLMSAFGASTMVADHMVRPGEGPLQQAMEAGMDKPVMIVCRRAF